MARCAKVAIKPRDGAAIPPGAGRPTRPPDLAGPLAAGEALDPGRHEVVIRGEEVALPLKEFELLTILLENAGRVLSRDLLIDRVWGHDYVGDTKTLDVHVKRLRSRVEIEPSHPERIVTVRGVGYKFVPSG